MYQAATGNCFDAQAFINDFVELKIPNTKKLHILNGMGYEIYFNSKNRLRLHPKSGYYVKIIQLLEMDDFYESKVFITSALCKNENQIIYSPGQNEIMDFNIEIDSDGSLNKIIYKGKNVLFGENGDIYDKNIILPFKVKLSAFITELANQIVAPIDYVRVNGLSDNTAIYSPYAFTIRNSAINTEEQNI